MASLSTSKRASTVSDPYQSSEYSKWKLENNVIAISADGMRCLISEFGTIIFLEAYLSTVFLIWDTFYMLPSGTLTQRESFFWKMTDSSSSFLLYVYLQIVLTGISSAHQLPNKEKFSPDDELLEIIRDFKNNVFSISEVETLVQNWQNRNDVQQYFQEKKVAYAWERFFFVVPCKARTWLRNHNQLVNMVPGVILPSLPDLWLFFSFFHWSKYRFLKKIVWSEVVV